MLVHAALVLVHEGVGLGEDGVDAGKRSGLDGTAQGDTEAALGAGGLELSQDRRSFLRGLVFDDQQEFVAAHAEDMFAVCGFDEDGGGALDEAVACRVPFRVILLLEAVDVAEDEGERGAVRDRADVCEQGAAVADACELVTVTVAPSPVAHLPGSVRTL